MPLAKLFSIIIGIALLPLSITAAEIIVSVTKESLPRVTWKEADSIRTACFELNGYTETASPGDPALPVKQLFIALPPDVDEKTVSADLSNAELEELRGEFYVRPSPPFAAAAGSEKIYDWGSGKTIIEGKNARVYGKNAFYPESHIRVGNLGKMRSWRLLEIQFYPFRYNPASQKLIRVVSADITVKYDRLKISAFAEQADSAGDAINADVEKLAANYSQAREWYAAPSGQPDIESFANTAGIWDYVIITRSSIANASTELANLAAHRQSQGNNVYIATETAWGGGTGDAAANSIRNWLKNNYLSKGIRYVLFIGNPNPSTGDVPMKMLRPRNNAVSYPEYKDAPSDYFFADLTGNWDRDGDGNFGEEDDDFGAGGIDRLPEVKVGRIPYYGSITDLDSILRKIIDYEIQPKSNWVRRMILPMVPSDLDTPGYHLGEAIKNDIASPNAYTWTRLYNESYYLDPMPEVIPSSYENVKTQWQLGAGFVFWWTHGSENSAVNVFSSSNCQYLDNTKPAFTFQCSCLNGKPENSQNLGYSILKRGGIATVSASRVSWYYPGQTVFNGSGSNAGMTYEYAMRLCANKLACGDALFDAKLAVTQGPWMNHCVFNLYGDPLTKWVDYISDPTPPTTPIVEADPLTTSTSQLTASWFSEDPESGITEYRYAVGTSVGGTNVQDWTSAGLNTSVVVSKPLSPGTVYFFSVKAKNSLGIWSDAGNSQGTCPVSVISARGAKSLPNGTLVGIPMMTANMNNGEMGSTLYVQYEDRSSGFKTNVSSAYGQITEGSLVALAGTVNNTGLEWQLDQAKIWKIGSMPASEPLFLLNKNVSGGSIENGGTRINGAFGAAGLNNLGLLIRTSGVVTGRDVTNQFFYIDDGSKLWDGSGYYGVRVYCYSRQIQLPNIGQKVIVTGISSLRTIGTKNVRMLRVRRQSDIDIIR